MANTTSRIKKTSAAVVSEDAANPQGKVEETMVSSESATTEEKKKSYRVKQTLDPNMLVTVKNGFNGTLVYKSKRTGERFIWDEFGDEQEIELLELKSAKNSCKAFFINNCFLFDDPEVIDWLGMSQYYKHALNADGFDRLFEKNVPDIRSTIAGLSDGQKRSVAFRAKQLIEDGKIDSIKVINALEESLNVELIER